MSLLSTPRATAATGRGNHALHCSVWTWFTKQIEGLRRQTELKKGIPLATSTTRSASRNRAR